MAEIWPMSGATLCTCACFDFALVSTGYTWSLSNRIEYNLKFQLSAISSTFQFEMLIRVLNGFSRLTLDQITSGIWTFYKMPRAFLIKKAWKQTEREEEKQKTDSKGKNLPIKIFNHMKGWIANQEQYLAGIFRFSIKRKLLNSTKRSCKIGNQG